MIRKSESNYRKKISGFTLVELLVVVAIIGLIASLSLVAFNLTRSKSRDTRRRADLKQIQNMLELYYDKNNTYPTTSSYSENNVSGWDASYIDGDNDGYFFADFLTTDGIIQNVPLDPLNNASHHYRYYYYNGTGTVYGCERPFYVLVGYGFETNTATGDSVCYTPWAGSNSTLVIIGGMK